MSLVAKRESNIWSLRLDPDNVGRMILGLAEEHSSRWSIKRLFSRRPPVKVYRLTTYIAYSIPDDTYVWRAIPVDKKGKVTGSSVMFCSGGLPKPLRGSTILDTGLSLREIQLQWRPDSEGILCFSEDSLSRAT